MNKVIRRLNCDKCKKKVAATNKLGDERFYCTICGRNLGIHTIRNLSSPQETGSVSGVERTNPAKANRELTALPESSPETIQIDKTYFEELAQILNLGQLKCCICDIEIDKDNFGYIHKDGTSCRDIFCLAKRLQYLPTQPLVNTELSKASRGVPPIGQVSSKTPNIPRAKPVEMPNHKEDYRFADDKSSIWDKTAEASILQTIKGCKVVTTPHEFINALFINALRDACHDQAIIFDETSDSLNDCMMIKTAEANSKDWRDEFYELVTKKGWKQGMSLLLFLDDTELMRFRNKERAEWIQEGMKEMLEAVENIIPNWCDGCRFACQATECECICHSGWIDGRKLRKKLVEIKEKLR